MVRLLFIAFFLSPSLQAKYDVSQFIKESKECYSTTCLNKNFKDILKFSEDVFNIIEQTHHSNLSTQEAKKVYSPYFSYLFSQSEFSPEKLARDINEVLNACKIEQEVISSKSIKPKHFKLAKTLCVKENFKLNLYSLAGECENVLNDAFQLIDISSPYSGSFASHYVNILVKNPKYDSYIVAFQKEIAERLGESWQQQISEIDRKKRDQIPNIIKDLDLGKLAFEITGNKKEAVRLLQVLISDPGARVINEEYRKRLRKDDYNRFIKMKPYLEDSTFDTLIDLGMYTDKLFEMDFKRHWSNRNYKAMAGLTLGVELAEKGHSEKLSVWTSGFIGEAYKVKAHILPSIKSSRSIEGDKPYFVIDSTAHQVGALLGHRYAQEKPTDKVTINRASQEAEESALNRWNDVDLFLSSLSRWL